MNTAASSPSVPDAAKALRAWTAVYRWPGRKEFLFGTAWVRPHGPSHEVESALASEFVRMWAEILPEGLEMPKLVSYRPGMLVLMEDDRG